MSKQQINKIARPAMRVLEEFNKRVEGVEISRGDSERRFMAESKASVAIEYPSSGSYDKS